MIVAIADYLESKGFSRVLAEAEAERAMRLCCDCGERFVDDPPRRCPHCRSDETVPIRERE